MSKVSGGTMPQVPKAIVEKEVVVMHVVGVNWIPGQEMYNLMGMSMHLKMTT